MKIYNIMVIDDEFTDRAAQYHTFFEAEYDTVDIVFQLLHIEYGRDIHSELPKHSKAIDAFFIDARLDDSRKGWGGEFGASFNTLLYEIDRLYQGSCIPPIFMLSKHWQEEGGLLTKINKAFSVFHNPLQASRYYSQEELEAVIHDTQTKDYNGNLKLSSLLEERQYIEREILRMRSMKYNSSAPVDAVLQIAVPDEMWGVCQALDIMNPDWQYLKVYGLSYQEITLDGQHIVIVQQLSMGMEAAARTAASAILAFRPRLIAMTGICAGKKGATNLGDIVIAREVFDYSTGKLFENSLQHRPPHRTIPESLSNFAINTLVNNSDEILLDVKKNYHGSVPLGCKIRFNSMGSGPWVVNTPKIFEDISTHITGTCVALDMEAYAVSATAHQFNTPWFIMKCVQDFADGMKEQTEKDARAYAAFSSAYVLRKHLPVMLRYIE